LNLLTNALVHGGDHLSKITMTIEASGQVAVITVDDDGVGIPTHAHIQAKSRFGQAGGGGGSGLGLPIAAKVAENHGGSLTVRSPRKGASVQVSLEIADTGRGTGT
jgi:two-component system sensor histidine kinase TctE